MTWPPASEAAKEGSERNGNGKGQRVECVWGVNDAGPASLARWMASGSSSRSYMIIAHMLIIGLEGEDYDAVFFFIPAAVYIPISPMSYKTQYVRVSMV